MKKFIAIACLGVVQVQAQNTIKPIKVTEFQVQNGFEISRIQNGTLSDFKKLAPESELLNQDFAKFKHADAYMINGNSQFSVMIGLKCADKIKGSYKANPIWRVGITYSNVSLMSGYVYKEEHLGSDTFRSSQSNQMFWTDTVRVTSYNMGYGSEQIRLDLSAIFRTNEQHRWSFYSGLGLTGGVSIQSATHIMENNYNATKTQNPDGNLYSYAMYSTSDYTWERFNNGMNTTFSGYIPLGVEFRLSKKRPLLQKMHLGAELRPSINITSIPDYKTITASSLQQRIGLRMVW